MRKARTAMRPMCDGARMDLRVPAGSGGPDDEAFWGAVREQFEPAAGGRSNLVTVVRGVTPRAIREQIAAESTRYNETLPR